MNRIKDYMMPSYIGDDTAVVVGFDHHPYEADTASEPGCAASITINWVEVAGDDILDNLNRDTIDRLEQEAFVWVDSDYSELKQKQANNGALLFSRQGVYWFSDPKHAAE